MDISSLVNLAASPANKGMDLNGVSLKGMELEGADFGEILAAQDVPFLEGQALNSMFMNLAPTDPKMASEKIEVGDVEDKGLEESLYLEAALVPVPLMVVDQSISESHLDGEAPKAEESISSQVGGPVSPQILFEGLKGGKNNQLQGSVVEKLSQDVTAPEIEMDEESVKDLVSLDESIEPDQKFGASMDLAIAKQDMRSDRVKSFSDSLWVQQNLKMESGIQTNASESVQVPVPKVQIENYRTLVHEAKALIERVQTSGKNGEMSISLYPKELGKVRVEVSVQDGAVSVAMFAERPEATQALKENWIDLKNQLSEAGMKLNDISVSTMNGSELHRPKDQGHGHQNHDKRSRESEEQPDFDEFENSSERQVA